MCGSGSSDLDHSVAECHDILLRRFPGTARRIFSMGIFTRDKPAGGGGTDVLDRELEQLLNEEQVEDGDHERFSHFVPKDKILESAVTGKPVRALCGKKWTPSRDPEKFPVCPDCKKIYDRMRK